jgi:hypothetical protein
VFTHQQIAHFDAFGYVVLRDLFTDDEVATLRAEVRTALAEAFGDIGTDTDPDGRGGIRGDYLPLSVDRAALSQALIADDPRLFQGSADLMGAPSVPTVPIATCFTTNAAWHTDQGPDIGGVKFLVHLEARAAETGALRVVPGSHVPAFARRLEEYWSRDPARQGFEAWPVSGVVLETHPGDVVAFDVHLFHASAGGEKRLAWTIEHLPWPGLGDPHRIGVVRELIADAVDYDHEVYDRERWPTWREWVAGARSIPSRHLAVQRLRLLGVLGHEDPG